MKKIAWVVVGILLAGSMVAAGLYSTGYLLARHDIYRIDTASPVDVGNATEAVLPPGNPTTSFVYNALLNESRDIPGIDKLTTQLFTSNDSMDTVLAKYKEELRDQGYRYVPRESGYLLSHGFKIYYHSFVHGVSGVVVAMCRYQGQTWICVASGHVLDLWSVYEYIVDHCT